MTENWITTLPEGWSLKQIRHIFRIHNGATPKSGESEYWNGDINWITPEDLGNNSGKEIVESRRKITAEGYTNSGVSLAPAGSIAVSIRAPIGHLAKTVIPSCVNQGCRLLELKEGNSDYWYYASTAVKPILVSRGQGTTFMELPRQSLASVKLPVPPIRTQISIARFLDFKTAQIDALICKQKALLDKLAEKRTVLISHAVTKGLDPSVSMKDSGEELLGEVPKHWTITRLRFVTTCIEQGWSPQCNNQPASEEQWGVLKVGCVNGEAFEPKENKSLPDDLEPKLQYEIKSGDILVSRANTKELLGGAALVNQVRSKLLLCDKLYRIKSNSLIEPGYLVRFMRSTIARFHYERNATGTSGSMQNIGQDTLKDLPIPLPPKDEQVTILKYLEKKFVEISLTEKKITSLIDKLTEYRASLINNAITGKIDVHNLANEG